MIQSTALPVIDIGELITAIEQNNPANRDKGVKRIAEQIQQAMQQCGFFYVSGWLTDTTLIDRLRQVQHTFFAQSEADKARIAINQDNRGYLASGMARMHGAKKHDQKEVFFWGPELPDDHAYRQAAVPLCGPNQWPEELSGFRQAVLDYSHSMRTVGNALLRAIAHALNLNDDFFESRYSDSLLRGQMIRYPQTAGGADDFGVAPHTDFGCITLLLQQTAGLEVKDATGQWIPAPPIEGTLVVNIGDLLERWSDKRLPSNSHRVKNLTGQERFSIAVFHDPNPTAIVSPQDMGSDTQGYEPVAVADYIIGRNSGAFSHYGEVERK